MQKAKHDVREDLCFPYSSTVTLLNVFLSLGPRQKITLNEGWESEEGSFEQIIYFLNSVFLWGLRGTQI